MVDQAHIDTLILNPAESLNVEVKRWIDPSRDEHIAKIVKGVFALRNRNGGYFIIGFDDKTLAPDLANEPQSLRKLFHVDFIQGLISKYAQEPFEIEVGWACRDHRYYPVIAVPSGVKVPVATKSGLTNNGTNLIKKGAVYFRSLSSNGTASTTEAQPKDWAEIVEICFDNREADVGRFIRRHLAGLDLTKISENLKFTSEAKPTMRDRAMELIDYGQREFQIAVQNRSFSEEEKELLEKSFFSIGFVITPALEGNVVNKEFWNKLRSSNPNYTGWPIWLDSSASTNPKNRPIIAKGRYQSLVVSIVPGFSNHIDFMQFEPRGEFFLHRLLQDDGAPSNIRPGTVLDPLLMIIRIAEAMAVGLSFAKALGCDPILTNLGFAFRWQGLKGRNLIGWANPFESCFDGGVAHDDTIDAYVQFSLDTPLSALPQFVDAATRKLFSAFDGAYVPHQTIEDRVRRLIERKL